MKKLLIPLIIFILLFTGNAFATVAESTSRIKHNCNGSVTAFTFTFNAGSTSEFTVILTDSTGTETVLTPTTNYSVSCKNGDCSGGGTVNTVATYASGNTITILRDVPLTQESDFYEGQRTLYESFEQALDKNTRIDQQQNESLTRSVKIAQSSDFAASEFTFPDPESESLIGWNTAETDLRNWTRTESATGDHADNHTDGTDDVQSATNVQKGVATAAQITDLEANTAAKHNRGHAITGAADHDANNWKTWYSDGSGDVNELALGDEDKFLSSGGTAAAPVWKDAVRHVVYPSDFGAVGDGTANDTTALDDALTSFGADGGIVQLETGKKYLLDNNLEIPSRVLLRGMLSVSGNPSGWETMGSKIIINTTRTINMQHGSAISNILIVRKGLTGNEAGQLDFAGTALTMASADHSVHVSDMIILGFNTAIDSQGAGRGTFTRVIGDCINGILVAGSADVTRIMSCHFWPFVSSGFIAEDGAWGAGNTYTVGQTVTNNGQTYACHTAKGSPSAAADEPGVGASYISYWYNKNYRTGVAFYYYDTGGVGVDWGEIAHSFSFGYNIGTRLRNIHGGTVTGGGADYPPWSDVTNSTGLLIDGDDSAPNSELITVQGFNAAQMDHGIRVDIDDAAGHPTISLMGNKVWETDLTGIGIYGDADVSIIGNHMRSSVVGSVGVFFDSTESITGSVIGNTIENFDVGVDGGSFAGLSIHSNQFQGVAGPYANVSQQTGIGTTVSGSYALVVGGDILAASGDFGGVNGSFDGGVTVGVAPTGGNKGAGTINVDTAIYLDNVAYANPDYVLQAYNDGFVDLDRWNEKKRAHYRAKKIAAVDGKNKLINDRKDTSKEKKKALDSRIAKIDDKISRLKTDEEVEALIHEPANRFDLANFDIDTFTTAMLEKEHLPGMPMQEEWKESGNFGIGDLLQRLIETCEVQAIHIKKLNDRLKVLELLTVP